MHPSPTATASSGRHRLIVLGLAALVGVGCNDATEPPPPPTTGLAVSAVGATTDTVQAGPVVLTAQLRDSSGRAVSGAIVSFRAPGAASGDFVRLGPAGGRFGTESPLTVATDENGIASAALWHETRAGSGWVHIEARPGFPDTTLIDRDSIAVETLPGNAVRLRVFPRDTALYEGNSGRMIPTLLDRWNNIVSEHSTLTALTDGIRVSATTVTAAAGPSRQKVLAESGGFVDTGFVSIVPRGVIAVRGSGLIHHGGGSFAFATLQLDGSEFSPFLSSLQPPHFGAWGDMGVQWEPAGTTLLFFDGSSGKRLYRTTQHGATTPVLSPPASPEDIWPQISANGEWVYFTGQIPGSYQAFIHRVRPDGSSLERISLPGGYYTQDHYPSPSPDGQRVVYSTDRENGDIGNPRLQILDAQTGTMTSLGLHGTLPRWSPTGEWIVFWRERALWIVRPDGTGLRRITAEDQGYAAGASWSADGRWIAAEHHGPYVELIEVQTGLTLPLAFTGYLRTPAWRP